MAWRIVSVLGALAVVWLALCWDGRPLCDEQEELRFGTEDIVVTAEQRDQYERDGFLVVRGALPVDVVDRMRECRPRAILSWPFRPLERALPHLIGSYLFIDSIWASSELFKTFWFTGPISKLVGDLILPEGEGSIRLLTDLMIGIPRGRVPLDVGNWHKDTYSYDILTPESEGHSVWTPLVDIAPQQNGGSLFIVSKAKAGVCQEQMGNFTPECVALFEQEAEVHTWAKGDVLVFTKSTIHKSQPIRADAQTEDRFALIARFMPNGSRYDTTLMEAGGFQQKKNSCNHGLAHGDELNSPCFPIVHPELDSGEQAFIADGRLQHYDNHRVVLEELLRRVKAFF